METHRRRRPWSVIGAAGLVAVMAFDPASGQAAGELAGLTARVESRQENFEAVIAGLDMPAPEAAAQLEVAPWQEPDVDTGQPAPANVPQPGEATVRLGGTSPAAARFSGQAEARLASAFSATGDETTEPDSAINVVVGGLPLTIAAVEGERSPAEVTLRVASGAEAQDAGVTGVLLTVSDAGDGAGPSGKIRVTVDYAQFAGLGGGDWASRLQVFRMPECAATDPGDPECAPQPIESVNDTEDSSVSAVLDVPSAGEVSTVSDGPVGTADRAVLGASVRAAVSSSSGATFAVAAAPSGTGGDWRATSLAPASSWGTSGSTGAFTWSYPLRIPSVAAGPAPDLTLSYSSAVSDGRTAATNNQASWVGEGFDLSTGFVERTFVPCADDTEKVDGQVPNNVGRASGDLCWLSENATLSLDGSSVELVKDAVTGEWHGKNDDGSRVERLTGGWGAGQNGEYWKVTTADGTQYFFGRDKRKASEDSLGSAWTVPVYGNHPGEPCHRDAFASSHCLQTWRWNLDYVVDADGGSMTYRYGRDRAAYRWTVPANSDDKTGEYNPGGYLKRVEYGTRAGHEADAPAPVAVEFTVAARCRGGSSVCAPADMAKHPTAWPDVPADQFCAADAAKCPTQAWPVFFDRYRLSKVATFTRSGSAYQPVDSWSFDYTWLAPNGSADGKAGTGEVLWLGRITHTGHGGTSTTDDDTSLLPVTLKPGQFRNRVPGTRWPAVWRPRLISVHSESGATTSVNYATGCGSGAPADQRTNGDLCYPVDWDPKDRTKDKLDWFLKYVVTSVVESGASTTSGPRLLTGSAPVTTTYTYGGRAAWAKPTGPLVRPNQVTYSDFRGFSTVTTTVGDETDKTSSRAQYLRGMGGTLTVGHAPHEVQVTDRERDAGEAVVVTRLNGGAPVSESVVVPGKEIVTATSAEGTEATRLESSASYDYLFTASGSVDIVTRSQTTSDEHGQPVLVEDEGDMSASTDDRCTRFTYAHEADGGLPDERRTKLVESYLVGLAVRTEVLATKCPKPAVEAALRDVVSDQLVTYDEVGKPLETYRLASELDRASGVRKPLERDGYELVSKVVKYDDLGRAIRVQDGSERVTSTVFTPELAALVSQVVVTSPDPDGPGGSTPAPTATTVYDASTGSVLATIDTNGRETTATYDGLGRLVSVRYPDRPADAVLPSVAYKYLVDANGLNVVTTRTIAADGTSEHIRTQFYDGLMRPFQTQAEGADAGPSMSASPGQRGRVVTQTFYDGAGRVSKEIGGWAAKGAVSTEPLGAPAVPRSQTTYSYDGAGRVTDQVFWDGTESNPDHERWRTTTRYDGRFTTVLPPAGGTAKTTITDGRGRTVQLREYLTRPGSGFDARTASATSYQQSQYVYDRLGQLASMKDAKGNTWSYTYDILGRQVSATDPDAGTTATTYDGAGRVSSVTNGAGRTLTNVYDALDRLTAVKEGSSTRATWTYDTASDTAGNPVRGLLGSSSRSLGAGQTYTSTVKKYDEAYRPTQVDTTLPASGSLAKLTQRTFTTTYSYTADGQVATMTLPQVTSAGSSGGTLVLGKENVRTYFDSASQPRWMAGGFGWGTYVADSRVSAFGDTSALDLGNTYGAVVSYAWDEVTGRLNGMKLDREGVNGTDVDISYRYDAAGNVLSMMDKPTNTALTGAAQQDNQCFSYDGLRRLTRAWTAAAGSCTVPQGQSLTTAMVGGAAPYWSDYTYDVLGNRTSKTDWVDGSSTTKRTTTYTYGENSTGPHALTSTKVATGSGSPQASMSFAYDGAGNLTTRTPASGAAQTLTWDVEGELTSVNAGADDASSFVYDADGSRVVRQDATGTTAYLPGGQEIHVDSSGDVSATRYYSFGGQTVAVRTDRGLGGVVSLVSDHHGTVVAGVPNTTWTTTSVSKQYTDPFGAVRGGSADVPGDRQFLGATRDDTGLTLLGARYYDENAGRFVSVDPILDAGDPQQWQGYAYANNNPATFSDPTGAIYEGGNSSLTASSYKYTGNGRGVAGTSVKATPAKVASKVAPSSARRSWSGTYVGGAGGVSSSGPASVAAPAGVSDYLFAQGGNSASSSGSTSWGGLVGGAAGVLAGAACVAIAAPTTGPGAIGCAAVGGAVAGAVSNLWDTKVTHTREFSAGALAAETLVGAGLAAVTAGAGTYAVGSMRASVQMASGVAELESGAAGVAAANSALAESAVAASRTYVDLTVGGSIRNIGTNATHAEFAETLVKSGWRSRLSSDGAVEIFEHNGARYVLRSSASTYGGWSADFVPAGAARNTLKLRLGFE